MNETIKSEVLNLLGEFTRCWCVKTHTSWDNNGQPSADKIVHYVESKIKKREDEIVEMIEQCSDFADSSDTLKKRIVNLIKSK